MELERVKDNRDGTFTFLFDEVTSKYSSRQKPLTFPKNGECWECVSHHTNNSGHCQFERNGKSILVHRYVYEHTKGKIPDGLLVRHTCDNPKCINPDHLLLGTYKDNCRDMFERGRDNRPKGTRNFNCVLTEEKVLEAYNSDLPARYFAEKFGCHSSTINYIRNGKNWGWLTGGARHAI